MNKKFSIVNFQLSIFVIVWISHSLFAQEQDSLWLNEDWYYSTETSSLFDVTDFLPPLIKDEAHLKRYIRDDRFYALRKLYDDTLAVDAIFDRAMLIADDDVEQALLIATFSVMDHRRLGLRIPLIGSIYLPLTAESDSFFRLRRTHLPKKLLNDKKRASDKDKLQHFFGSAYVAYLFNSSTIARWIGDLFETGEDRFVLGGRTDERDKLANEKGREFGLRLLRDTRTLPSDVLWH
ncbi:MAG: hypothetical protein AB1728_15615 [Bacteroidota bacterium]